MFRNFCNVWTPVVPSSHLGRRPLATRVAGEALVLFRTANGGVSALADRCPHRGVALSRGVVTEDGCLECPFHGWRFDANGSCAKIPLNEVPIERRERLAATAFPARDAGGLIWVFTGDDAGGEEPAVPEALVEPGWSRWVHMETWNTHWTRAMENMLDSPHVPYLHRRTIGRGTRARLRPDSVMRLSTTETPTGWMLSWTLDDDHSFRDALAWRRPNGMVLNIASKPGRGFRQHVWCIPEDDGHVRMLLVATRQFLRYNPLGWLGDQFNRLVLLEDRAVVESSHPPEVPPAGEERSVASDGPTLLFRKYYYKHLRAPDASVESLVRGSALNEPTDARPEPNG